LAGLLLTGCGGSQPTTRAPDTPPTPISVTKEHPGGDASNPEKAAIERLLREPWGFRRDRWGTLRIPLADWRHWRRVKIFGQPTRATFRYGDEHYALDTVWYQKTEGANDPEACLERFMAYAVPLAESYAVKIGESSLLRVTQQVRDETRPMVVKLIDGRIDAVVATDDYVGAIAVYQSWPGTCLVQGFAVLSTNHRDIALKVRDRWVAEAAPQLLWDAKVQAAPEPKAR
jgi:hypothetical protein